MRILIFISFLVLKSAQAQDLSGLNDLATAISEQEFQKCIDDTGHCKNLPGEVITNSLHDQIIPEAETGNSCKPKKKKKSEKTVETKLLLVSEGHTSNIDQYSSETNRYGDVSDGEQWERSNFVEGLIQSANGTHKSDEVLSTELSNMIKQHTTDDAEKYKILTTISSRLYDNYNNKRNPLQNTNHDEIASGNISLQQMFSAAATNDFDHGGVCDDISQSVATVAEKLFPDKDVLVINNGSHFGVLVHDQKNGNKVINWSAQSQGVSQVILNPKMPVGVTNVLQMHNGALETIAVLDTETGAVMKKYFSSPTKTLLTGTSPSVIYAELKKEVIKKDKTKTFTAKLGTAQTSNTQMVVLVGQVTKNTKSTEMSAGLGMALQNIKDSPDQNVIINLNSRFKKNLIHFQSKTISLVGSGGVELDALYGKRLKQDNDPINVIPNFSGNLQTNQTVNFKSFPRNEKNPSVEANFQVVQALGATNEGAREGKLSDPEALKAVINSMKYMGFHLNQVNADASVSVPVSLNALAKGEVEYQGSNIGQKFKVTSGVQVVSSGGMKIYAFVGYMDNQIKGFKTKGSLFTEPSGVVGGVDLRSKGGSKYSADVQGIGGNSTPQVNVNAVIPIFNKTKKKNVPTSP